MSRALYRTYRSRSLDEVVGQEHITDLLKQALKKDAVSHAYLLTGPRGIGKTSVARILAHEINALPYSDDPQLDIIEIDAASNRRIDDIRDLRDKVRIAPVSARYKVYIIDEVHMLTTESFNALLKTLEEPPAHVVFILATTEVHKVPATILSRTQRFHFRPVGEQKVADHLDSIAEKEGITTEREALELIARHGGGSFRDSIGLLDQLAGNGTMITKEMVEATLGLVANERLETLVQSIMTAKTSQLLSNLKEMQSEGVSPAVLSEQLIRTLSARADEQPGLYQLIDQLLEVPKAYDPFIKLIATLVRHSESHKPRTVATTVTLPTVSTAVTKTIPKPKPQEPVTDVSPKIENEPEITVSETISLPPTSAGTFDWESILEAAKKHNAPLHSVLGRARMEYVDGTLTLHFLYALHRKKLEQPQYHSQLTQLIIDICGDCPTIIIKDGKTLSVDASNVAAIMGGGEPVNAR